MSKTYRFNKKWRTEKLILDFQEMGSFKELILETMEDGEDIVDVKMTEGADESYTFLVFIAKVER